MSITGEVHERVFIFRRGWVVWYEANTTQGLFSCIAPTLAGARRQAELWIAKRERNVQQSHRKEVTSCHGPKQVQNTCPSS